MNGLLLIVYKQR